MTPAMSGVHGAPRAPRPVRFLLHLRRMRAHLKFAAPAALSALAVLGVRLDAAASWRSAADSLYAVAERSYAAGDYRGSASLYGRTVATITAHDGTADAYLAGMAARSRFLEARSLEHQERWDDAIAAYRDALTRLPAISDAVRVRLGRCYRERGDLETAVAVLREVLDDGSSTSFDLSALESLGDAYYDAEDGRSALHWYGSMLRGATDGEDLARAHYKIGLAHERRGDAGAARSSFATAVNEYPRSAAARDALKRGRADSRAFTDRYHQGLVVYNRGGMREAAEYFTYYLRHENGGFEAEAAYFLGRCHQRTGNMRAAAGDYERVIGLGVEGEYTDLAWAKFAYCLRRLGKVSESLAAYDRYASLHPEREGTAHILWEKARLLEEERRWDEARDAFRALAEAYPSSDRAGDARFRAGLCLFKLGKYREAEAEFANLSASPQESRAARALYWAAKVQERFGRTDDAVERYRDAARLSRDSFYGRRSLERLSALGYDRLAPAAGARGWASDLPGLGLPWSVERQDFAAWLADWHDRVYVPGVSIALREQLSENVAFVRADLFLGLHMPGPAAKELTALETAFASDPRMLDVLIGYYERGGQYRRAIRFAERILSVSPAEGLSDAPVYLRKRICPTHWRETVVRECGARGIDSGLVFSLIRQESLFEPDARSGPGASGLTQIMPPTARWIATRLGHRNFQLGRLRDPETNIAFGVYYLAVQLEDFDGDVFRALAAYNAGPGNVARWWKFGGTGDSDVFFEDIGFAETREYVERVYRYYQIYREIYEGFTE